MGRPGVGQLAQKVARPKALIAVPSVGSVTVLSGGDRRQKCQQKGRYCGGIRASPHFTKIILYLDSVEEKKECCGCALKNDGISATATASEINWRLRR